jgi:hypothetical protein
MTLIHFGVMLPGHADALQPNSYLLPYQIIVTSHPFELLDVAVPLIAAKAAVAACVHVPGHWISNPRAARQQWLQQPKTGCTSLWAYPGVHVIGVVPGWYSTILLLSSQGFSFAFGHCYSTYTLQLHRLLMSSSTCTQDSCLIYLCARI